MAASSRTGVCVGERPQLAFNELHAVHFLKQLILFCTICSAIIIFMEWYLTWVFAFDVFYFKSFSDQ